MKNDFIGNVIVPEMAGHRHLRIAATLREQVVILVPVVVVVAIVCPTVTPIIQSSLK